jgi:hypothetical protein
LLIKVKSYIIITVNIYPFIKYKNFYYSKKEHEEYLKLILSLLGFKDEEL